MAKICDALREWDYGIYEGRTTPEIRQEVPGWTVWTHPCPGGETAEEVGAIGRHVDHDTIVVQRKRLEQKRARHRLGIEFPESVGIDADA